MSTISSREELRAILPAANPTTAAKVFDHLDDQAIAFLDKCPFLLLGTVGDDGFLEVSPKGDGPGFVVVEDANTLLIPDRPGNNLAFGLENIIDDPKVGLLFIVPGTTETLRISGPAEITTDEALCKKLGPADRPPVFAIRVTVTRSFFHCAKAFMRSHLWQPETWPEKQKISFGKMIAKNLSADETLADQIDTMVNASYAAFDAKPGD